MQFSLKSAMTALCLGATALTGMAATTASAQPGQDWRDRRGDDRGPGDRGHGPDHRGPDRPGDRGPGRFDDRGPGRGPDRGPPPGDFRRPGPTVYNYDWNRPDPRYGRSYRPDRYYRGGYAPIRVDRSTRIYRGYDDKYYCRRSDGTTGLIVGAAIGSLLGSQLDRGRSNTAGILIGGGAGALLGQSIDKGNLNCR